MGFVPLSKTPPLSAHQVLETVTGAGEETEKVAKGFPLTCSWFRVWATRVQAWASSPKGPRVELEFEELVGESYVPFL